MGDSDLITLCEVITILLLCVELALKKERGKKKKAKGEKGGKWRPEKKEDNTYVGCQ